jgi:hypothetical protein
MSKESIHENWVRIPGFSLYEVSSLGKVRNRTTGRVLRPGRSANNTQLTVSIRNDIGTKRSIAVHRLMAFAFLELPQGCVVDHINRDPLDNRLENLRVVSRRANMINSSFADNAGVSFHKHKGKWWAYGRQPKRKSLGYYQTRSEAEVAVENHRAALSVRA